MVTIMEQIMVSLMGTLKDPIVLEPNGSGFDVRQQVIMQSAALHLHVISVRGRLLQ